jgi:hypothetical protein
LEDQEFNATGLTLCDDPERQVCEDRSNHPEEYCIHYQEVPWCDKVNICDDEGEITSNDQFFTGEAVRDLPSRHCPVDTHSIEGDESGQCYRNHVPCPEDMHKIPVTNPDYPGDYYCDN